MSAEPRFLFGPLEQRALLMGLRGEQVAVAGVTLLIVLAVMWSLPAPVNVAVAFLLAGSAAAVCFVPFAGRTVEQWTPVTLRWAWQRARGRHRYRSRLPSQGHTGDAGLQPDLPDALAGVTILSAPVPGGEQIGVVHDRAADTFTAVLTVAGSAFALLESAEKQRLLAGWDAVLRSLGGEASPIVGLQWIERTAPDDGDALGRDLRDRIALDIHDASVRSYLEVLDDAGPVSTHHEVFLAVTISPRRAARLMRQHGTDRNAAACAVLIDQVRLIAQRLTRADLRVLTGGLSTRMIAKALRLAFDPQARNAMARRSLRDADAAGTLPANAWPLAGDTTWRTYRTDSAWHATFWIAEWPRSPVGTDFLAPLLLFTSALRTVSVTMAPVGTGQAIREAEHARTSDLAEQQLRESRGFLTSYRKAREHDNVHRRAAELQEGYADFRFSGYITVSAATDAELDTACAEVVHAAQQSGLELRRLVGEQDTAFTYTLPLGRGL
jgi:hypothetical protein